MGQSVCASPVGPGARVGGASCCFRRSPAAAWQQSQEGLPGTCASPDLEPTDGLAAAARARYGGPGPSGPRPTLHYRLSCWCSQAV
eukprot:494779-Pelagomonas_calceolata.AAC.1